jgi:hypothetical protein
MKTPSDFVVPSFRKFRALTYDSLIHVREQEVTFSGVEDLPKSNTLLCFGTNYLKFYTRECVLLQVIQNKDVLNRTIDRWKNESYVTILVHLKYKSNSYSTTISSRSYKFSDVNNRPIRITIPDVVENLTDAADIRRFQSMLVDHCYVFELEYTRGIVSYAKLLADTTASKRMGKPSWLQE